MKIRFLGTSYGAPSRDRYQQSILIEDCGGFAYIFDAGAPVLDVLIRSGYSPSRIRAVFISHLHGDHINGLNDMLNLSAYYNMAFTVYMPEQRGIDTFLSYYSMMTMGNMNPNVRFDLIREGEFFTGGISVSAEKTAHTEGSGAVSYAFSVSEGKTRLCITGDLHPTLKDFPRASRGAWTVAECAHFTPEALVDKAVSEGVLRLFAVHVMPEGRYAELERLKKLSPIPLITPSDNDEYTITEE